MTNAEEWKPIDGSSYEVSSYGRVRNIRTGKMLTPRPIKTGYLRIHISVGNKKRKDFYIHRLVAEKFCIKKPYHDVVNHIDNDMTNNKASNLEWTTQRGNVLYAMEQGRMHNFPNAIKVIAERNGREYQFRSIKEASEIFNVDGKTVWDWCENRLVMKGFAWRKVS